MRLVCAGTLPGEAGLSPAFAMQQSQGGVRLRNGTDIEVNTTHAVHCLVVTEVCVLDDGVGRPRLLGGVDPEG